MKTPSRKALVATTAAALAALSCAVRLDAAPECRVTVRPEATRDALVNPGMGWVFYYYDNSNWNYGADTAPGDTLDWFPGCSTIYFRIPWCDLEPSEGDVRWDVIDSVAQPWIAAGKQIAFRFTCSESAYDRAVPEWVSAAGAKGSFHTLRRNGDKGRRIYEPDWLDPVFMEKFEKFLAAAGRRWNGNPSVAFVDVGSFGMWGEGHTVFTSNLPREKTDEIALVHARMHKRHFPDTPVVVSDDVAGHQNMADDDPLMAKMREIGIGFRDDSIMVAKRPSQWYHASWARRFAEAGLPVVVESRHFFADRDRSCWYEGGLLESTVAYRASYQGIHWWPDELLRLNRAEIEKVNLRLGYRLVLKEASWPKSVRMGDTIGVGAIWANAGVVAPNEPAFVCWTLLDDDGTVRWASVDETFDLRSLPPCLEDGEKPVSRTSSVRFGWNWPYCGNYYGSGNPEVRHDGTITQHGPNVPTLASGEYSVCVSVGRRDGTPRIALPLGCGVGATRRYLLGRVVVTEPR